MTATNDSAVDSALDPMSADPEDIISFNDVEDPDLWVRPGLPHTTIDFVDHDPAWATQYAALSEQIRAVLGSTVRGIAHVGSSSVPGLAAKPIIDIALVVPDPRQESDYRPHLHSIDCELVVREPSWYQHRVFKRINQSTGQPVPPMCNLHVFGPRCPEVARMRLFRDWLSSHPEDRDRYQEAKLRAVDEANAAGETVADYNVRKQDVIRDIYARIFRAMGWI